MALGSVRKSLDGNEMPKNGSARSLLLLYFEALYKVVLIDFSFRLFAVLSTTIQVTVSFCVYHFPILMKGKF